MLRALNFWKTMYKFDNQKYQTVIPIIDPYEYWIIQV